MIWLFAGIVLGLALWALRDEFRSGGLFTLRPPRVEVGELLEFPLVDGWDRHDILTTLAEIEAL